MTKKSVVNDVERAFFTHFHVCVRDLGEKKKNKRTNQLLDSQIMASPPDSPQPCLLPFIHTLPPQPAKIKDTSLYSPLHFIHCNKGHSRSTGLVPYAIPFNPSPVDSTSTPNPSISSST